MNRLTNLRSLLQDQNLDACLISSPATISYLTGYAGFSFLERDAYVVVTQSDSILLTSSLYFNDIQSMSLPFTIKELSHAHPFDAQISSLLKKSSCTTLGIQVDDLRVNEYVRLKKQKLELKAVDVKQLRILKDHDEIADIKKACDIGNNALKKIIPRVKSGMTEQDVAWLLEKEIRNDKVSLSFPTIVAFGKNSAVPHHHANHTKLHHDDHILIDFGVRYNNYCSDMTRTFSFGKQSVEQKNVQDVNQRAQEKAVAYITRCLKEKKEIRASDVDNAARSYIISQKFPSIPHSLGHGIGIEVHEAPSISPKSGDLLTEGMVFSLEPGIYLPEKFGVRTEDLYAIIQNKLIRLT